MKGNIGKISHSKYKNTGILFEILAKRVTADTMEGKDSPSIGLIKKYFVNTELGKEYKLYETVFKRKILTENNATDLLNTVLEFSKKLNRTRLRKEKYNLINDLKEHYNIDELFKTKVNNYKAQASLYVLLEIYNSDKITSPETLINNKQNILEYLTKQDIPTSKVKEDLIEEFKLQPKDVRLLTSKILLERFNEKYSDLSHQQKRVLNEFITSVDNTEKMKNFYNNKVVEIKEVINVKSKILKDETTKIKLDEVVKLIVELDKKTKINQNHLINLLQYYSLIEELNTITNGK